MKKYLVFVFVFLYSFFLSAQTGKPIIIETKHTALVLTVGANQRVIQSYLGKKLASADYEQLKGGREAYLTAGMENQFEPSLRIIHSDGNPSLELRYVSHKTVNRENITTTDITLKDPEYPVEVLLHYSSYFNEDVVTAWTEIKHKEQGSVLLSH
ncbi:MAG TPA: glycoside hydrolase family 36 N-terminal domain-containing protein, partial [Chitinophagaceae bacterium]|nr:glycoside hydrolase family 36 N-terminal domain-containing protein [Chitinophagaceae bacterium]